MRLARRLRLRRLERRHSRGSPLPLFDWIPLGKRWVTIVPLSLGALRPSRPGAVRAAVGWIWIQFRNAEGTRSRAPHLYVAGVIGWSYWR